MTDNATTVVASAPPPGLDGPLTGTSSFRISNRIARFLTISVIVFALTTIGFTLWITREHNRLAGSASEQMVRGGFSAMEAKLRTVTMDYAIWPEAVNAINGGDIPWVWENIGVSAAVTETTDLMLIQPTNADPYGWVPGMEEDPKGGLLPEDLRQQMNAMLDQIEKSEREAVSTFVKWGDAYWMLSAARIVSDNPEEDPGTDAEIPRYIFGFELDEELVQGIGEEFLINDLALNGPASEDGAAIDLSDHTQSTVASARWTPPRPGDEILRQIAVPLAVGLGMLTLVAFVSASLLSRSARRLESTMMAAQAASRAKTDFIANISHELRTPMNGIMGLTSLLDQTQLDDKQRKMVGMLSSSAQTQMTLIGDLLDISSIENGHLGLNMGTFEPADVVRSVSSLFEIEATNKGLSLNVDLSGAEQVYVLGDKERYRQICSNIISNAVKFTSAGEVNVELTSRERLGEASVALKVTDTGPGIHSADREQIFERFAQGRSKETGKASGTGLGLSITRTIVELMGGKVTVDSTVGEGSVFRVEIPFELSGQVEAVDAA